MRALLGAALIAAMPLLAAADSSAPRVEAVQDEAQTLADIRQQLAVLRVEMQTLTRELSTTGAPALGIEGTTYPERVEAMESRIRDLSNATERLAARVEAVSRDGANRIEDLRFQLCDLTADCDIASLPDGGPLGGASPSAAPLAAAPAPTGPAGPELAVGEQTTLDAARTAMSNGRPDVAEVAAVEFLSTYPASPLSGDARLLLGEARAAQGDANGAARAYLDAFSGAPDSSVAPVALIGLGRSLKELGQSDEACLTLDEVSIRFPDAPEVQEAAQARVELGCL